MGKKVLIAGGMAGGASAAARVRRLDETAEIILFERGEYISYANCGLPYHVGGVIAKREALLLQALGLSVTIIEMLDQMMAPLDHEMALMLQDIWNKTAFRSVWETAWTRSNTRMKASQSA